MPAEEEVLAAAMEGAEGADAAPQQFCLRWNNYQSNLTDCFDRLLRSESFVDVTLACDGHSLKAHKVVLSACSPYFQSLFADNPCQHPIVIMRDIKYCDLKAVVDFMYRGEINVSQDQIAALLKVAETLKIRGLTDVNGDRGVSAAPAEPEPRASKREGGREAELRAARRRRSDSPPASSPAPSTHRDRQHALSDDVDIRPGIAEMIREEERAKLIESSQAWLGASTSSIAADSYQYRLQSMWQKCWNTNQTLVHNLRYRERGPLKSWRPETMAEAIFSVLKEGLSLSQAARKYDIPYPTFVLYANRVHNMLGPSADGGTDLRPKGRGRPQRILLGIWPDDHIRSVIRAVVFRDSPPNQVKEEPAPQAYTPMPEPMNMSNYVPGPCGNGAAVGGISPDVAAAAAVAAVAHGLRRQMCSMVAAAQCAPEQPALAMPGPAPPGPHMPPPPSPLSAVPALDSPLCSPPPPGHALEPPHAHHAHLVHHQAQHSHHALAQHSHVQHAQMAAHHAQHAQLAAQHAAALAAHAPLAPMSTHAQHVPYPSPRADAYYHVEHRAPSAESVTQLTPGDMERRQPATPLLVKPEPQPPDNI